MNCTAARDTYSELLDHRTPATAHLEARAHLAACPDCQREFSALSQTLTALDTMPAPSPSPRLRQNFYAMLEEEKHSATSVRVAAERQARRVSLLGWILSPLAAAALVALGFFAGTRQAAPAKDETNREIAKLREEVKGMKTVMVASILTQQQNSPANERLKDVLAAAKEDKPSEKILNDLVSALAFDPSVNVRLRALEALYKHADNVSVRSGVLAALPREQNPLVQLELIDFVAAAHDANAASVLETIAQNEQFELSVRDAARTALAQL